MMSYNQKAGAGSSKVTRNILYLRDRLNEEILDKLKKRHFC